MLSCCTNYLASMPEISVYVNCDTRLAINLRVFELGEKDELIFSIKNFDYKNSHAEIIRRIHKKDEDPTTGEVIFCINPDESRRLKPDAFYNLALLTVNKFGEKEYLKLTENGNIRLEYGASQEFEESVPGEGDPNPGPIIPSDPISEEKIKEVIENYCKEQEFVSKDYVDSKECDCDTKGYATQKYVDDAIANIEVGCDTDTVKQIVNETIIDKNLADKEYVDSKQCNIDADSVKEIVKETIDETVATKEYVDKAIAEIDTSCECDTNKIQEIVDSRVDSRVDERLEEKDVASKQYVDDMINSHVVEMENKEDPLTLILNGGDSDPETHYDDDEILNVIFNGGLSEGF